MLTLEFESENQITMLLIKLSVSFKNSKLNILLKYCKKAWKLFILLIWPLNLKSSQRINNV